MAKGKFQKWLKPEGRAVLTNWARMGLTDEQIARKIGIAPATYYVWQKRFPEISEAIKDGKEVVDAVVVNALIKQAKNGNVQAQTFWLRNRMPEYFRDQSYSDLNKAQAEKAKQDARKAKAEADLAEAKARREMLEDTGGHITINITPPGGKPDAN